MNSAHTLIDLLTDYLPDVPWLRLVVKLAVIVLVMWGLLLGMRRLLSRVRSYASSKAGGAEEARRIHTLTIVFRYAITFLVVLVTVTLVLSEVGVSIAPVLGAAGILGVAVGLGGQSLVKDFLAGLFLLVENQVRVGDVVNVGGKAGFVEAVTLRHVRLRDYGGDVHFVPTGSIGVVTNQTMEFSYALVDVSVAYREDPDEVFSVLREVGNALRNDALLGPKTVEDLEIAGVEELADSAVVIRCRMKTVPLEQWNVRRELLKRFKRALAERGLEIPFPQVTVWAGEPKRGEAAPFGLRRSRATGA